MTIEEARELAEKYKRKGWKLPESVKKILASCQDEQKQESKEKEKK